MITVLKPARVLATAPRVTAGMAAAADIPESEDPSKVILNDWAGQYVSAKIAGELLK